MITLTVPFPDGCPSLRQSSIGDIRITTNPTTLESSVGFSLRCLPDKSDLEAWRVFKDEYRWVFVPEEGVVFNRADIPQELGDKQIDGPAFHVKIPTEQYFSRNNDLQCGILPAPSLALAGNDVRYTQISLCVETDCTIPLSAFNSDNTSVGDFFAWMLQNPSDAMTTIQNYHAANPIEGAFMKLGSTGAGMAGEASASSCIHHRTYDICVNYEAEEMFENAFEENDYFSSCEESVKRHTANESAKDIENAWHWNWTARQVARAGEYSAIILSDLFTEMEIALQSARMKQHLINLETSEWTLYCCRNICPSTLEALGAAFGYATYFEMFITFFVLLIHVGVHGSAAKIDGAAVSLNTIKRVAMEDDPLPRITTVAPA